MNKIPLVKEGAEVHMREVLIRVLKGISSDYPQLGSFDDIYNKYGADHIKQSESTVMNKQKEKALALEAKEKAKVEKKALALEAKEKAKAEKKALALEAKEKAKAEKKAVTLEEKYKTEKQTNDINSALKEKLRLAEERVKNIEKEVVDTEVSDAETDTDEAAYVDEDDYYDPGHGELEDPEDQDWGDFNSNNDENLYCEGY